MTAVNELLLIVLVVVAFLLLAFAELFWSLAHRYLGPIVARSMGRDEQQFRSLANADAVASGEREAPVLSSHEGGGRDREREVRIPLFDKREDD